MEQLFKGVSSLAKKNSHVLLAGVAGYSLYQAESQLYAEHAKSGEYRTQIAELERQIEEEKRAKCAAQQRVKELEGITSLDCRQMIDQLSSLLSSKKSDDNQVKKQSTIKSVTDPCSWLPFVNVDNDDVKEPSKDSEDEHTYQAAGSEKAAVSRVGRALEQNRSFRSESALISLSSLMNQHSSDPKERAQFILLCLLNAYEVYLDDSLFEDDSVAVAPLKSELVAYLKEKIADDFDVDAQLEKAATDSRRTMDDKNEVLSTRMDFDSLRTRNQIDEDEEDEEGEESESEAVKGVREWVDGSLKQQHSDPSRVSVDSSSKKEKREGIVMSDLKGKDDGQNGSSLLSLILCYLIVPLVLAVVLMAFVNGEDELIKMTDTLFCTHPCPIVKCPIVECPNESTDCTNCASPDADLACLEARNDCELSLRQAQVQREECEVEKDHCEQAKMKSSQEFERYLRSIQNSE